VTRGLKAIRDHKDYKEIKATLDQRVSKDTPDHKEIKVFKEELVQ
jgi:hypothetical protein